MDEAWVLDLFFQIAAEAAATVTASSKRPCPKTAQKISHFARESAPSSFYFAQKASSFWHRSKEGGFGIIESRDRAKWGG